MAWHKYPYTDYHELNLDWILEQINGALDVVKNYVLKSDYEKTVGEVSNIKQSLGNIETNVSIMNSALNQLKSDLSSAEADIQQKVDSNTLNTELNNMHDDIINQIDDECEKLVHKVNTINGAGNTTDYPSTAAVYDRITSFRSDNPETIVFFYSHTGDSSTYEWVHKEISEHGTSCNFLLHVQRDGEERRNWIPLAREYTIDGYAAYDFIYTDLDSGEWTVYTISINGWSIHSNEYAKIIKTGFVNGFSNASYNLSSLFGAKISKLITAIPVGTTDSSISVQVVNALPTAFTINVSRSGTGGNLQINYIS